MDSSAKTIKATGIIHIIHGAIVGVYTIILMIALSTISVAGGTLLFLLTGGIAFFFIYVGYVLFSLSKPSKVKGFLIASLVYACIEVVYSVATGQMAGIFFIIEFVMDIICLSNLDAYRKYKKSLARKTHKRARR